MKTSNATLTSLLPCYLLLGLSVLSLGVMACEEEKAAPTPAPVVVKEAPKAAPVAAKKEEPPAVALESIPTEESFEDEASTTITTASFEKQVDSLEKEMSSE